MSDYWWIFTVIACVLIAYGDEDEQPIAWAFAIIGIVLAFSS